MFGGILVLILPRQLFAGSALYYTAMLALVKAFIVCAFPSTYELRFYTLSFA
jgi:hypothetical protein